MTITPEEHDIRPDIQLRKRSFFSNWAPLILGFAIAISGLELVRTRLLVRLEAAALGTETQNIFTGSSGTRVLCQDASDSAECVSSYTKAGRPPAILWLGNSQLPAINRYEPGDGTAPTLLHDALRARGRYVVAYAQPNANLFEHALIFATLADMYNLEMLLLPVFMDDIREQGIRSQIRHMLSRGDARTKLEATPVWPVIDPIMTSNAASTSGAASVLTLQQRVESRINEWLSRWWLLWEKRANLRGIVGFIQHTLRNKIMGINAQSKRRVDPTIYREKMAALDALLETARARGIKVLLYVPPYRQDIAGPYIAADYTRFKTELAGMARRHGAEFANLEAVVPGPEWGKVVDAIFGFEDYDFMHFTGDGHRRHAEAIDGVLKRLDY